MIKIIRIRELYNAILESGTGHRCSSPWCRQKKLIFIFYELADPVVYAVYSVCYRDSQFWNNQIFIAVNSPIFPFEG